MYNKIVGVFVANSCSFIFAFLRFYISQVIVELNMRVVGRGGDKKVMEMKEIYRNGVWYWKDVEDSLWSD